MATRTVVVVPDGSHSDDRSEASAELVTTQRVLCVHARHNLHTFQPHKLQVRVVETVVRQHLATTTCVSLQNTLQLPNPMSKHDTHLHYVHKKL